MPSHVRALDPQTDLTIQLIKASAIGQTFRSTVATHPGVVGDLRTADTSAWAPRIDGLSAAEFSYNSGSLACSRCKGAGEATFDVQFLRDVDIVCPDCDGTRFCPTPSVAAAARSA